MNAAELAEHLGGRKNGRAWMACCPAHEDRKPSLSITNGDNGLLLVRCFAGCSQSAVIEALSAKGLWPKKMGEGGRIPQHTHAIAQSQERSDVNGLNLEQYAAQKKLPVARLREWGLSDYAGNRGAVVRIPYRDLDGAEIAVRYRGTGDAKHFWKTSSHPALYGIWLLGKARAAEYVVLVEGESDAHTLWLHDIPAVGVPGAKNWKEDWAALLEGIPLIYVVIEPDEGGEAVKQWVSKSAIRSRVRLLMLHGAKDPSELYLADPNSFAERWQAEITKAVAWAEMEAVRSQAALAAAWEVCSDLARQPDILAEFSRDLTASGVSGETRATRLLYLVVTSRLLPRPVSAVVKGPSSGGKSYTTEKVLHFFPPEAFYALSGMSEHALAYSEEPLVHRMLVIYEAAGLRGEFASYLVRSLLSEGRVRYETVEKTDKGLRPRLIEREGPTGLIVTTTAVSLHPENETRLLSVPINDTPEQTRSVLQALASETERPVLDVGRWHALQQWLAGGECRVTIPYAGVLAALIPPVATRLRRDFSAVLGLIRAHALLHQATREVDADGRVIATLADYAAMRELINDLIAESAEVAVPPLVRETVMAVADALASGRSEINGAQLGGLLKLDPSTANRRAHVAIAGGFLVNLETAPRRPARLVLGNPLVADTPVLPDPDIVAKAYAPDDCAIADKKGGVTAPPSPLALADESSDLRDITI